VAKQNQEKTFTEVPINTIGESTMNTNAEYSIQAGATL
jgi:hypothetical protein